MTAAVIIPAAGRSSRMGLKTPKPFLLLDGSPILARTISVFEKIPRVTLIQPVLPEGLLSRFSSSLMSRYSWSKCRPPIPGGLERQDSVERGLDAIPESVPLVIIHDAARPFVSPGLVERVLDAAMDAGAALAAVPVHDTVKEAMDGRRYPTVRKTVSRDGLWLAQTPQAFRTDVLKEAFARASSSGWTGTDEASLVEMTGHRVVLVEGSPFNFKITTPQDLAMARVLAGKKQRRQRHCR